MPIVDRDLLHSRGVAESSVQQTAVAVACNKSDAGIRALRIDSSRHSTAASSPLRHYTVPGRSVRARSRAFSGVV